MAAINEKNIFQIRNLHCAYKKNGKFGRTVLHIEKLDIERGKIIVLLGKSGAGKSTILETLGLMNNTANEAKNTQNKKLQLAFMPEKNKGKQFDIAKLWQANKQAELSEIRNEYLSFIFQNTNLMPNFTAYENICITQMLQNVSQEEAVAHAKKMMKAIDLGEVDEEKQAHELSGGQRQRIAFVRAITPRFSILFGDEPTGNLDEITSNILMNMLTQNIKGNKNNQRTAIIVTHNIDLALKYADQIILITKPDVPEDTEQNFGSILSQNHFYKLAETEWEYQEEGRRKNINKEALKKQIIQLISSKKILEKLAL
ncbi:MAG: ABC transporter ATP-binding protein [Chitinophagales bacterium]